MILTTTFILILLLSGDIYFETNFTKLNKIAIEAERPVGNKDIKILQISDYHNFKENKKVLALAKTADADFIVITGDLIDRKTTDFNNVYSFIEDLKRINSNIYYVPGNHEWSNFRANELIQQLALKGINILNNEKRTIEVNDVKLNVYGVNYEFSKYNDINTLFKDEHNELYTILLCHRPGIAQEYENIPVNLIISGHSHGGQIRLPIIGAIVSSGGQLFPKYNKGLYKIFENTLLYIDSGVGTARFPVRFMNRSQVSLITINTKKGL